MILQELINSDVENSQIVTVLLTGLLSTEGISYKLYSNQLSIGSTEGIFEGVLANRAASEIFKKEIVDSRIYLKHMAYCKIQPFSQENTITDEDLEILENTIFKNACENRSAKLFEAYSKYEDLSSLLRDPENQHFTIAILQQKPTLACLCMNEDFDWEIIPDFLRKLAASRIVSEGFWPLLPQKVIDRLFTEFFEKFKELETIIRSKFPKCEENFKLGSGLVFLEAIRTECSYTAVEYLFMLHYSGGLKLSFHNLDFEGKRLSPIRFYLESIHFQDQFIILQAEQHLNYFEDVWLIDIDLSFVFQSDFKRIMGNPIVTRFIRTVIMKFLEAENIFLVHDMVSTIKIAVGYVPEEMIPQGNYVISLLNKILLGRDGHKRINRQMIKELFKI